MESQLPTCVLAVSFFCLPLCNFIGCFSNFNCKLTLTAVLFLPTKDRKSSFLYIQILSHVISLWNQSFIPNSSFAFLKFDSYSSYQNPQLKNLNCNTSSLVNHNYNEQYQHSHSFFIIILTLSTIFL